jgi:hypothetical protein
MALDELKEKARTRIETDNPGSTNFKVSRVYENLMDGTVISVSFQRALGKKIPIMSTTSRTSSSQPHIRLG